MIIVERRRSPSGKWEENAMTLNPQTAAARLVGAQADAMRTAAGNTAGAAVGFMEMSMAQGAGGVNAQNLYAMGTPQHQRAPQTPQKNDSWQCSCGATVTGNFCQICGSKKPASVAEGTWECPKCHTNTGKFCSSCGEKKPSDDGWTCSCGAINKGKFCSSCEAKKPVGARLFRCDKCGREPEDPAHPPKFCPECGDIFDDNDTN